MIKKLAAGVAGLGLVGGVGTVVYNKQGDATVRIKDEKTGQVQTVTISGVTGQTFSCPSGTRKKLEPYDIELGRIKITLNQVRSQELQSEAKSNQIKAQLKQIRRQTSAIERQYPNHQAPPEVVDRYNTLRRHDDGLVSAYNLEVRRFNALRSRETRLVSAYNSDVDTRNSVIDADCSSADD